MSKTTLIHLNPSKMTLVHLKWAEQILVKTRLLKRNEECSVWAGFGAPQPTGAGGGWACVSALSSLFQLLLLSGDALDSNSAELTQVSYPYLQHWCCSPHGLVCFAGPAHPWTPPPADSRCCCCHPASSLEMSSSLELQDRIYKRG